MTDTDNLSKPSDMVNILKLLTKVLRDVETLPDSSQQRFWNEVDFDLRSTPPEEIVVDRIGERSVSVVYNVLTAICGPKLAETVNGGLKQYYEDILAKVNERAVSDGAWEMFLERHFAVADKIEISGIAISGVNVGGGTLMRVDGVPQFLKLTNMRDTKNMVDETECYFATKDVVMVEFLVAK